MAMTYGDCWRTVRLHCPSAPTFLAREWVNVAWKQLLAKRRWGFMRGSLVPLPAPDSTSGLITLPADFASFKVVVDPTRQVRISFWHTLDEWAATDPGLTASGTPSTLIATTPSSDPATLGQARYRPYPAGSATFNAIYHRQGHRLTDQSVFPGVLADGGEVLTAGALAQAALWPGTGERPNPYFNATLAQAKAAEFAYGTQMLSLRDDEQYPDDLWDSWMVADCGLGGAPTRGGDVRATDACACS